jgi:hypothetical protein
MLERTEPAEFLMRSLCLGNWMIRRGSEMIVLEYPLKPGLRDRMQDYEVSLMAAMYERDSVEKLPLNCHRAC